MFGSGHSPLQTFMFPPDEARANIAVYIGKSALADWTGQFKPIVGSSGTWLGMLSLGMYSCITR